VSYYLSNSRFEPATHWAAPYYERYFVPKAGMGVDVTAPLDHRPMFTAGIMRERFFTGVGHGGKDVYTGDFYDRLIEVGGRHMDYVEGKTSKWLSCLTGAELGPAWMEKGGKIYHGYVKTYQFSLDPKYFPIPWRDPKAGLFFHPYINGLTALYKGETNHNSWEIEHNGYLENAGKVEEDDPELADKLRREARIFKYFGEPTAKWK